MADTITLNHSDLVKLAAWDHMTAAKVGTIEGMCAGWSAEEVARALRTARDNSHEIAFVTYAGASISSSRAFYDRKRMEVASAIVIEHGQNVEVEGRTYTVEVLKGCERAPKYCDPIRLTPV